MSDNLQEITVERAHAYTPELAADLGQLLTHLSDIADGQPIDEAKLRLNIELPSAEQFLAYDPARLVGAATLTLLGGLMPGNKAWLEDFVVAPDVRGRGVADAIADECEVWSRERGVSMLLFTSSWQRQAAHKFYLRRGARIINDADDVTAFFNYPIPKRRDK